MIDKAETAITEPQAVPVPEKAAPEEFTLRPGDAMHHEGSTCTFCGQTAVCGHSQLHGPAVCFAAPWVPNVWVKSCG